MPALHYWPLRWWAAAAASILVPFVIEVTSPPTDQGNLPSPALQPGAVRPSRGEAEALLALARRRSPTVEALFRKLDVSEIVVYIELHHLRSNTGQMTFLSAAGGVRRLRIALDSHLGRRDSIVVLGHELFHALEVAAAPAVRDEVSLRALYEVIGFTVGRQCGLRFDTADARATARSIAQEVDTLRGVEGAWTPR